MPNQEHKCNIHHYIPQFYLRWFTSSVNTTQKRRLKICWRDKSGDSGNDLIGDVKCIRLFRPQFRKVKIRFVVEIP